MKKKGLFIVMICFSINMIGQVWSGTSLNGNTYRNGNVGIGKTNPSSLLHLLSYEPIITLENNANDNTTKIAFIDDLGGVAFLSTDGRRDLTPLRLWTIPAMPLSFGTTNTQRMIITSDGNIGIGINFPTTKLDVGGNINIALNNGLTFGGIRTLFADGNGNIEIGTNGCKVGIGTSTPNEKLEVNKGSLLISGEQSYPAKLMLRMNFGGRLFEWVPNLDGLFLYNNSITTCNMSVLNNGYVGIGTATPTSLLTVAGKIESREVEVKITAGADFVFEEYYPIKSLDEVETFIKEHKHLPEIPTAKEMEENGLSLGEMNIKLLQKIEELTLYLIELNKTLNKQDEKILLLESEINKLKLKK